MKSAAYLGLALLLPACASGPPGAFGPPRLPKPVVTKVEVASGQPALPLLRIELVARRQADEWARQAALGDTALGAMAGLEGLAGPETDGRTPEQVAEDNAAWLASFIAEHGRPARAQVGKDGMEGFAALCQRSLHEPALAAICVELLDDAVLAGELPDRDADRMRTRACARFGTTPQLDCG